MITFYLAITMIPISNKGGMNETHKKINSDSAPYIDVYIS